MSNNKQNYQNNGESFMAKMGVIAMDPVQTYVNPPQGYN